MKKRNELTQNIELMSLISQIPISLVAADGNTIFCSIPEEHHYLPPEVAKIVIDGLKKKNLPKNVPYMHIFTLNFIQGVIKLNAKEYIFVGPVNIIQVSLDDTVSAYSHVIPKEEILRFHSLYEKSSPTDFFRFAGILAAISNNYHHTSLTPSEVINMNYKKEIDVQRTIPVEFLSKNTISIEAIIMFLETLSSDIAAGNIDALIKHWQSYEVSTIRTADIAGPDMLFFFIPFYTFMFQGAIKGGADINLCFEKYTVQIERMKMATNSAEYITEIKRASYEYCNLVTECSKKSYMPETCSICVDYINDHIQEKITVDDLSHLCGVHKNKLYDMFHAHFDMTIGEYIEKERLRRSVIYLESSHYTISEIASTMGYTNQSHFTQIFKKHYGCTPGQYIKSRG